MKNLSFSMPLADGGLLPIDVQNGRDPRAWFRWLERKLGWHLLIVAKLRQMEVTIFVVRR